MPPPLYPLHELLLIVQLFTISVEGAKPFMAPKEMPPPPPKPVGPPAVLPLMRQLLTVTASLSLLDSSSSQKMPPPASGELPPRARARPLMIDSPSMVTVCCRIWKMRKAGVPPAVLRLTVHWLRPGQVLERFV